MQSHRLIPKCVLKKFQDSNNSLHCFDVKSKVYSLSRAAVYNTEDDYYSQEVEQALGAGIESPLGSVIKSLKSQFDSDTISISGKQIKTIKDYVYSLMVRSSPMHDQVAERLIFREWFTAQDIHDMAVIDGLNVAQQDAFLDKFYLTLTFNHTNKDFVLCSDGYCDYLCGDKEIVILVPLTPKIAAYFYKDVAYFGNHLLQATAEWVGKINDLMYQHQLRKVEGGHIIANNKSLIDEAVRFSANGI